MHNRANCFRADNDFATYLGLLEESCGMHSCHVHAYVLMPNHVHLLLTPDEPRNVSGAMRRLGQRYVRHFNYLDMVGEDRRFIESYRIFLREMPEAAETSSIRNGATYEGRRAAP